MKVYTAIAVSVIFILLSTPIIALSSITNLLALGTNSGTYLYEGGPVSNDDYAFGNCTFWVALLRSQIGDPIPGNWGNAISWAINASKAGYVVDHVPSYGAIMQDPNAPGGLGHVAFVVSVDQQTGAWSISEMNRLGFDEVDSRTLPATDDNLYNFIHDK